MAIYSGMNIQTTHDGLVFEAAVYDQDDIEILCVTPDEPNPADIPVLDALAEYVGPTAARLARGYAKVFGAFSPLVETWIIEEEEACLKEAAATAWWESENGEPDWDFLLDQKRDEAH